MTKSTTVTAMVLALAAFFAAAPQAAAQERIVVEERTGEVLRVVGRTVVIRNDLGEVKQYTDLPEDVRLYIDGEPAQIEDLEEGMMLYGVRWENVPAPIPVSPGAGRRARQSRAARIAPYRHRDPVLDSAMRFVAETVTEEPARGSANFQVWIPDACTLRFDQLNAGGYRVPVHLVNLEHIAPDRFLYRDSLICLEATSLENRIGLYELPVDPEDGTYRLRPDLSSSRPQPRDRFCFRLSGGYSYRVWRALAAAIESCGGRTEW